MNVKVKVASLWNVHTHVGNHRVVNYHCTFLYVELLFLSGSNSSSYSFLVGTCVIIA